MVSLSDCPPPQQLAGSPVAASLDHFAVLYLGVWLCLFSLFQYKFRGYHHPAAQVPSVIISPSVTQSHSTT